MGFIEDEKRRQAAILNALQQRDKDLESERVSREKIKAAEEAHREELLQQSKQYFEQSGLREMIDETDHLGMIHSWGVSDGSAHIVVSSTFDVYKIVDIDTTPDGVIKIQGGLFGSTTLPKSQWSGSNGREVLEKALEKAYKHPKSVGESYWKTDTSFMDSGRS